jgi:capsule polysaccharide export protein KpsC/LpsZ
LQYQPELSTSPLADVFADQQLIVQMISKFLPKNVYLYVKEHPKQTSFCRTIDFYRDLLQTKNVVLVRKDFDSFDLINNCVAVATSTGTPGWEALFREKPVLMFGSYIYQFADGVYKISTNADCRHALDQILNHHTKPSLKNMKLYLKALGEVSIPAVIDPDYLRVSKLTEKQNIENITHALLGELNQIESRPVPA